MRKKDRRRDVNKLSTTVKDSDMCQEVEAWGLGQFLFFDTHLFSGSQFQVGSSYLQQFSSPWIIY